LCGTILIVSIVSVIYWSCVGVGILSMFVFNAEYDFKSGECSGGYFCYYRTIYAKQQYADCSGETDEILYGKCFGIGIMGFLLSIFLVPLIAIVLSAIGVVFYFIFGLVYIWIGGCYDCFKEFSTHSKVEYINNQQKITTTTISTTPNLNDDSDDSDNTDIDKANTDIELQEIKSTDTTNPFSVSEISIISNNSNMDTVTLY